MSTYAIGFYGKLWNCPISECQSHQKLFPVICSILLQQNFTSNLQFCRNRTEMKVWSVEFKHLMLLDLHLQSNMAPSVSNSNTNCHDELVSLKYSEDLLPSINHFCLWAWQDHPAAIWNSDHLSLQNWCLINRVVGGYLSWIEAWSRWQKAMRLTTRYTTIIFCLVLVYNTQDPLQLHSAYQLTSNKCCNLVWQKGGF